MRERALRKVQGAKGAKGARCKVYLFSLVLLGVNTTEGKQAQATCVKWVGLPWAYVRRDPPQCGWLENGRFPACRNYSFQTEPTLAGQPQHTSQAEQQGECSLHSTADWANPQTCWTRLSWSTTCCSSRTSARVIESQQFAPIEDASLLWERDWIKADRWL